METIDINTQFRKQLSKNKFALCYVSDIFDVVYTSRKTGKTDSRVIYTARSKEYGMNEPFEVSKTTIIRGLIK